MRDGFLAYANIRAGNPLAPLFKVRQSDSEGKELEKCIILLG